jgi:DNA-binding NarL/FixJ family response regulator
MNGLASSAVTPPRRGVTVTAAPAPRVALYTNRPITRASLAALLRGEGIEVVLQDEPCRPRSAPAPSPAPDVVLLAGLTPDPELTLQLVREHRAPLLLLLDQPLAEDALPRLGARGAVCRECPPERLIEAVRTVADSGTYFRCIAHAPAPPEPPAPLLSARERRVASELARGAQIEEIATALCISPHTARTHVRNIRRKLGARTSAQAVAVAITMGLVGLPER